MLGRKSRELVSNESYGVDTLAEARQKLAAFEEPPGSREEILAFQAARREVLEIEEYGPGGFMGRLLQKPEVTPKPWKNIWRNPLRDRGQVVGKIMGRLRII